MISLGEFRIKCDVHFAFKTGQQSENRFFFYISFTYEVAKRKCLTVTGDELKMVIVPTFYRQKCGNKQFHRRQPPQKDNYSKKKCSG